MIKALLLAEKKFSEEQKEILIKRALKSGIDLTVSDSLSSLKKQNFDVWIVHEKLALRIKKDLRPSSKILLLVESQTDLSEVYRKAKRLNCFTIHTLPLQSDALFKSISQAHKQLLEEKKASYKEKRKGITLAITSFKGGAGKSLVSYNLACHLTRFLKDNQILLIDQSFPFGASRAFLNIESKFSWDTVRPLLAENKLLSKKRLFGVLNFSSFDFSLLTAPESFETNTPLTKDELEILKNSAKEYFSFTIGDFPTTNSKSHLEMLNLFDNILVVFTPEPSCLFNTYNSLSYLRLHQKEIYQKMLFLANKIDSRSPVTAKVLQDKLKINLFGKIEEDLEAVNIHLAKALPFEDENLVITQDFKALAEGIFKLMS